MYYRTQLDNEEIEFTLSYIYIKPKTIAYEVFPGVYEEDEKNNAFQESLDFEVD